MDMILYLIAGLAVGALIGWLLGKSAGRTQWEQKNEQAQQEMTSRKEELQLSLKTEFSTARYLTTYFVICLFKVSSVFK